MKIKIKKTRPDAVIPVLQHEGDSGFDFVALDTYVLTHHDTVLIPTGLAFEIPVGFELQIRSRSGLSKQGVVVANGIGTVDSGYRGEVGVLLHCRLPHLEIVKGMRIAQGVICPVVSPVFVEEDDLSETTRGVGGFGSTGQ